MSEKKGTNFNNLKEIILLEEIKNCVHPSIRNYITEHNAKTLQKASEMAVELFLTNIFFYRVPKIPLLKETFTMRKIFLLLTVRHQMYTQILIHHTSKVSWFF